MTDLVPGRAEHRAARPTPFDHRATSDALRHAAHEYLFRFGWTTRVGTRSLDLVLDNDQAVLLVPERWAAAVFDHLVYEQLDCPVLRIPGHAWGFLAAYDGAGTTASGPGGTRLRLPGSTVPLPPGHGEHGELSWIRPPAPNAGLEVTIGDVTTAVEKVIDTVIGAAATGPGPDRDLPLPLMSDW